MGEGGRKPKTAFYVFKRDNAGGGSGGTGERRALLSKAYCREEEAGDGFGQFPDLAQRLWEKNGGTDNAPREPSAAVNSRMHPVLSHFMER